MSLLLSLLPARLTMTTPQQQLKDKFFSDLDAAKSGKEDAEVKANDDKEDGKTSISKPKAKPKLQLKKKVDDDPFASDEEEETKPKARPSKPPSRVGGAAKKLSSETSTTTKRIREEFESDEGEAKPRAKVLKSKE